MKWTLKVGNISVALDGPARWVRPFAQAWGRWAGGVAEPIYKIFLEQDKCLSEPEGPLFSAKPGFRDSRCFLEAPGFAGKISLEERSAVLRAHPAAALGDIAYFLRTAFALYAFEQGSVLFHAAGVVHRNVAWAFFGPSGSGKTTLARLSRRKEVLSDDLLLLVEGKKGWDVWATPFSLYRGERLSAPLQALMRLIKAPEDRIEPLSPGTALGELVASSPVVNADPSRLPGLLARWERIINFVPVFSLHFRKSEAFWEVIDAEF